MLNVIFSRIRNICIISINVNNLHLIFFTTELLILFSRYQQYLKSDSTTICDMVNQPYIICVSMYMCTGP